MEGRLTSEPHWGRLKCAKATLLIPTFLRYTGKYTYCLLLERSSGAWLIDGYPILRVFYNFWEILQFYEISDLEKYSIPRIEYSHDRTTPRFYGLYGNF